MRDLFRAELELLNDGSGQRIALDGSPVPLASLVTAAVWMAAHDLTTNSVKHGSLSIGG